MYNLIPADFVGIAAPPLARSKAEAIFGHTAET
jgi:hypothetical protein